VSSYGQIIGYFVGLDEYEEFKRDQDRWCSFATADLPEEKVKAIGVSSIDARHADLGAPCSLTNNRVAAPT
jgi:hypothetical protein